MKPIIENGIQQQEPWRGNTLLAEIGTEMPSWWSGKRPETLQYERAVLPFHWAPRQALHIYSSFLLAHLGFPQPRRPRSTWPRAVTTLGAALRASDSGLRSKAEPLPNGPQHLAPCSLLIVCSLSIIVAWTCTFFCWWFWHPHRALYPERHWTMGCDCLEMRPTGHTLGPQASGIGRINGVQLQFTVYHQPSVALAAYPPLHSFSRKK